MDINTLIDNLAQSHIECWRDRYYGQRIEQIVNDLYLNHDDSLEREAIRELLPEATEDEMNEYVEQFVQVVIKKLWHNYPKDAI